MLAAQKVVIARTSFRGLGRHYGQRSVTGSRFDSLNREAESFLAAPRGLNDSGEMARLRVAMNEVRARDETVHRP